MNPNVKTLLCYGALCLSLHASAQRLTPPAVKKSFVCLTHRGGDCSKGYDATQLLRNKSQLETRRLLVKQASGDAITNKVKASVKDGIQSGDYGIDVNTKGLYRIKHGKIKS